LRENEFDLGIFFYFVTSFVKTEKIDELMHKALFEMSEGKTLIVITHRLEYLKHYDRIILMENGEIVDQGTYQEITNKPDGKLRRFIEENSRS